MDPLFDHQRLLTRRQFFGGAGLRVGGVALGLLMGSAAARRAQAALADLNAGSPVHPALPGLPHFAPRAKSLIYLHMNGGPAQLDLWDYKPQLAPYYDQQLPDSIRRGQRITTMTSGQSRLPVAP